MTRNDQENIKPAAASRIETAAAYEAGRAVLQDVGEEGWEAVCSWAEVVTEHYEGGMGSAERRTNHILFKRPA